MKTHILFVEDDVSLRKSYAYILEKEGFVVSWAHSGEEAVELARRIQPHLLLLDLVLPGIDGFEVCRRLENDPRLEGMYIIMLTGKSMEEEIIHGLELYADDYITKPIEPPLLLARIRAVLRRTLKSCAQKKDKITWNDHLCIDIDARELYLRERLVPLNRTEFDLMVLLARNPNRVFSREQILNHIRSDDFDITDRVVDSQVSRLRGKLGDLGSRIVTVRGVGYKFRPPENPVSSGDTS
ncbi:MAG: response regulator transcription factor [Candidatus Aminicenantes bacterium]|nr:response regulator transcription factor [Candidatus Aminicenantes bacterium]